MTIFCDGDIFYHQSMIEFYENFFNDKSGRDNTQIYARYPKYTFDEFRDHMEQLFQDEMSSGDNFIDLIDEDLYEDVEIDNIDPCFSNQNQAQLGISSSAIALHLSLILTNYKSLLKMIMNPFREEKFTFNYRRLIISNNCRLKST